MRGARGAWDLLCVLLVLLRGQTGGKERQTRGLHPPGAARVREGCHLGAS